jgi:hypothetical protein
MKIKMKTKLVILLTLIFIPVHFVNANDAFISGTGKTHGEARNAASRVAFSQSMKIVGQNHSIDKNGNWTITLRVRPIR